VFAIAASLGVTACGGSGPAATGSASPSTTSGASGSGGLSSLRTCLSKHGVELPAGFGQGARPAGGAPGSRPSGGAPRSLPAGVDQQKFQAAIQACGGFGGGGGGNAQALSAYLSCLGDHGVKVPTSTSGSQADRGALSAVRSDPNFAAANTTCRTLLPTGASRTTTTG
jgi:hypothetical protein